MLTAMLNDNTLRNARRLIQAREFHSLTAETLAAQFSIPIEQLHRYESGLDAIDFDMLQHFTRILAMPWDYFTVPGGAYE